MESNRPRKSFMGIEIPFFFLPRNILAWKKEIAYGLDLSRKEKDNYDRELAAYHARRSGMEVELASLDSSTASNVLKKRGIAKILEELSFGLVDPRPFRHLGITKKIKEAEMEEIGKGKIIYESKISSLYVNSGQQGRRRVVIFEGKPYLIIVIGHGISYNDFEKPFVSEVTDSLEKMENYELEALSAEGY